MAQDTAIEWADDTANFWEGCTQISPACDFCYAKERAERYGTVAWNGAPRKVKAGVTTIRLANNRAKAERRVRLVFINSLSDVFDNNAPEAWRDELFHEIRQAPWVHALLLTKRIGNAGAMIADAGGWPRNASLGATIVNQAEWDRDIGKLASAKAIGGIERLFVSMEPMLGPIVDHGYLREFIDAVIVGGESGPNARPMHPAWARSMRDQCAQAGTRFFFKQWGEWAPLAPGALANMTTSEQSRAVAKLHGDQGTVFHRVGKKAAGRRLDGRTHDDFLAIDRERAAA